MCSFIRQRFVKHKLYLKVFQISERYDTLCLLQAFGRGLKLGRETQPTDLFVKGEALYKAPDFQNIYTLILRDKWKT